MFSAPGAFWARTARGSNSILAALTSRVKLLPMESHETLTEERTEIGKPQGLLGLLWVHPEERFTPFADGMLTLGRDASASVPLPSNSVSRRHATICRQGAIYVIHDRQSRNGTFRNGEQVTDAPLNRDDVVRLGEWVGVVVPLIPEVIKSGVFFSEPSPGVVVGPQSLAVWKTIERFAPTDVPVVLQGPTGTGKEVVAHAIHELSGREGPFVAQNCGALPESLAEAHLFGYARGAFTGAHNSSPGLFLSADGGTLLLDEISDLPQAQQVKLLRVLEEKVVFPLGKTTPQSVDVRLIAAGQQAIENAVENQSFRGDLLGRLSGVTITLPPLCERREEIRRLFVCFSKGLKEIRSSFVEALLLYSWPRNIRELKAVAARASIQFRGENLGAAHFQQLVSPTPPGGTALKRNELPARSDVRTSWNREKLIACLGSRRAAWFLRHRETFRHLDQAMKLHGGNISSAAAEVGISRQKAQRLLATAAELEE